MVATLAFAKNWPAGSAAVNASMGSAGGRALRWEDRGLVKGLGWPCYDASVDNIRFTNNPFCGLQLGDWTYVV